MTTTTRRPVSMISRIYNPNPVIDVRLRLQKSKNEQDAALKERE